jgi:hypothetical protein
LRSDPWFVLQKQWRADDGVIVPLGTR